jgi:arylsulfatase A-like enzyme
MYFNPVNPVYFSGSRFIGIILSKRITIFGFVLLLLGLITACGQKIVYTPNFLVILVDDLGERDIGCYGQQYIETPNIDRLASQGMRWTNAYSSAPVCSPTRVALLTGKNQARVHFTGHITSIGRHRHPPNSRIIPPDDLMDIPLEERILPEVLKPIGYHTISIGKWHVGREGFWPVEMGFDQNIAGWTHGSPPSHFYPYEKPGSKWNAAIPTLEGGEPGEYLADRLTDEAMKFINQNRENPFLVYLPYYAVHKPLQAPEELVRKYRSLLQDTGIDPVYAAMVENLDYNVGRLLKQLDKCNLTGNTVVIFTSDNGGLAKVTDNAPYRLGKGHLYEGGLRIPLIMRWPGHIKPGSQSANLAISEDIFATIVDIANDGINKTGHLDGRSLAPDFSGEVNTDIAIHWYYPHYAPQGNKPGAAIRSGSYKLIEFYDPPEIELYNLAEDIGETVDLSKKMPAKSKELQDRLQQWFKSIDPIMHTPNPEYKEELVK